MLLVGVEIRHTCDKALSSASLGMVLKSVAPGRFREGCS